ncbi:MAG: Lrp/AsnC family transcriptional regulator [Promethearchaeota archaeon]
MKKEKVLDEIDKNILRILQNNARTSYREIQDELGISIGTIHNRISKLKDRNIIEGYTLKLNNEKLGYKLSFLIRINCDGKFTEEILNEISQIPEVCGVFHTTGEQSAALICRFKESGDVHEFIRNLNQNESITRTNSNMILKEYKNSSYIKL